MHLSIFVLILASVLAPFPIISASLFRASILHRFYIDLGIDLGIELGSIVNGVLKPFPFAYATCTTLKFDDLEMTLNVLALQET